MKSHRNTSNKVYSPTSHISLKMYCFLFIALGQNKSHYWQYPTHTDFCSVTLMLISPDTSESLQSLLSLFITFIPFHIITHSKAGVPFSLTKDVAIKKMFNFTLQKC